MFEELFIKNNICNSVFFSITGCSQFFLQSCASEFICLPPLSNVISYSNPSSLSLFLYLSLYDSYLWTVSMQYLPKPKWFSWYDLLYLRALPSGTGDATSVFNAVGRFPLPSASYATDLGRFVYL